jgi:hypothetical protein
MYVCVFNNNVRVDLLEEVRVVLIHGIYSTQRCKRAFPPPLQLRTDAFHSPPTTSYPASRYSHALLRDIPAPLPLRQYLSMLADGFLQQWKVHL